MKNGRVEQMSEPARANKTVRIHTIPATVQRYAPTQALTARLRVAAYARVSTDQDEQLTSYEAQVDYYTRYIKANPQWEFVEVYADEGISATNTKKRKNFNRMIEDAMNGKIDRIVAKSVSRFARNTVDTLTTIRSLKERGVGVFFEKENIDTLDSKGELLITIMGSLAQEESRSISENVTWGWRKRISDGKVSMPYKRFLGYERGEDGLPCVVESEAKIVRAIYGLFLDGQTPSSIASLLTKHGIPSPGGKSVWYARTVQSILTNEKYRGDALLQKTFTVDFLNKTKKANEGEIPQYYVENSHPAIVSGEIFELVQHEMARRRENGKYTSTAGVFSGRLFCGECDAAFGNKVWHSTDAYRRVIWQCNRKYQKEGTHCNTPHLTEDEIKSAFMEALVQVLERKQEIVSSYREVISCLCNTLELTDRIERLKQEEDAIYRQISRLIRENASIAQDQAEYKRQYEALEKQHAIIKDQLATTKKAIAERTEKRRMLERFISQIEALDQPRQFDESLFIGTIDRVIVRRENDAKALTFRFKDGTEIPVKIKKKPVD